jgi:cytochrome P450
MNQYQYDQTQITKGKFLVGSLPYFYKNPINFMHESSRFGDVVKTNFGHLNMVFVFHPEAFESILQVKNKHYTKSQFNDPIKHVLGLGLLSSEGKMWARDRRIIAPIFQNTMLHNHFEVMKDITAQKLEEWKNLSTDKFHNLAYDFMDYTIKVIAKAMFSDYEPEHIVALADEMPFLLSHVEYWNSKVIKPPLFLPTLHNRMLKKSIKKISKISDYYLDRQKKDPEKYNNLLSGMLKARDENGQPLPDAEIRNQILTFLIAGHETTAISMGWALYHLCLFPGHLTKIREELAQFKNLLDINLDDLDKMDALEEFIMETMRLFPPSWIIDRACIEDVDLMGVPIKKGDIMMLSAFSLHHDPRFWDRPELFNPDRFNKAKRPNEHYNYSYVPFGVGPRSCVARKFAMAELKLSMAVLIRNFDFELATYPEVEKLPMLTLRAKNGVWVKLHKR